MLTRYSGIFLDHGFTAAIFHPLLSGFPQSSLRLPLWIFVSTTDVLSIVPAHILLEARSIQATVLTRF